MARKKGSVDTKPRKPRSDKGTGKKAEGQQGQQAAPQAPSMEQLSEDEQSALFVQGIGQLEELVKQKDSIINTIRSRRGAMEARGFSKADIDFGLKLRGSPDKEGEAKSIATRRRREFQIAKWLNHPLAQMDLFDGGATPSHQPIDERAFAEGRIDGIEGKPCSPPASYTGPTMQKWIEGWHAGQEVMTREGIKAPTAPVVHSQNNTGDDTPEPFDDMESADEDAGDGDKTSATHRAADAAHDLSQATPSGRA